jgi:hypothetical protein
MKLTNDKPEAITVSRFSWHECEASDLAALLCETPGKAT